MKAIGIGRAKYQGKRRVNGNIQMPHKIENFPQSWDMTLETYRAKARWVRLWLSQFLLATSEKEAEVFICTEPSLL